VLAACSGTRTGPPEASASPSPTGPTSTSNPNYIRIVVPPGAVQDGSVKGWMRASVLKDDPPGDTKRPRKKKTDDADDGDSGD